MNPDDNKQLYELYQMVGQLSAKLDAINERQEREFNDARDARETQTARINDLERSWRDVRIGTRVFITIAAIVGSLVGYVINWLYKLWPLG